MDLVNWLKENVGDNIQIVTPQFERLVKREFEHIPQSEIEFNKILSDAPISILKGFGFGKWDSINNIIRENKNKPVSAKISIPIINSKDTYDVEIGRGNSPTELLEIDEDIWLFPYEWYSIIPNGFVVTGLNGENYPFEKGVSDDDMRFGCLPYGFRRAVSF